MESVWERNRHLSGEAVQSLADEAVARARKERLTAFERRADQRVSAPNFQMLRAVSASSQRLSSSVRNAMWSRNSSRPRP